MCTSILVIDLSHLIKRVLIVHYPQLHIKIYACVHTGIYSHRQDEEIPVSEDELVPLECISVELPYDAHARTPDVHVA